MPYYIQKRLTKPYYEIFNTLKNGWEFRYQAIAESFHGKRKDNEHTHHIDHNKLNDTPTNLCYMTQSEHHTHHNIEYWSKEENREKQRQQMISGQSQKMQDKLWLIPEIRQKYVDGIQKFKKTDKFKENIRKSTSLMKEIRDSYSPEEKRIWTLKSQVAGYYDMYKCFLVTDHEQECHSLGIPFCSERYKPEDQPYAKMMAEIHEHEIEFFPILQDRKGQNFYYKGHRYSVLSLKNNLRKLKKQYGEDSTEFKEMLDFVRENIPEYNHFVTKIERLGRQTAYKIITEKYDNFAIEAGIFVGV